MKVINIKIILKILFLASLISCRVNSETMLEGESQQVTKKILELPFRQIDSSALVFLETIKQELVWMEEESFNSFWASLSQSKIPEIDFTREYAIGVFSGFKPNSGYKIKIVSLSKKQNTLVVYYKETLPNPERSY